MTPFKDNYMIGSALGSGHHSEVRHCKNITNSIVRAVKIYNKNKMNEYQHSRLKQDIYISSRLSHPGILKLYELYEDEKRYYLVMECLTGGELYEKFEKEGMFCEEECCKIMTQIVSAVVYLHKNKVVHRNL